MTIFRTREISYVSAETGMKVRHYIVSAQIDGETILISHANLYLYSKTRASIRTSERYAIILSTFYRFLSTLEKYKSLDVGLYHAFANNKDVRRWQVTRQQERLETNSARPSSETIYEDAKLLMQYFRWLGTAGYQTNVNVSLVNWIANFKDNSMKNYLRRISKQKIDPDNIRVLDKVNKQHRYADLITDDEIQILLESYVDPVYPAMFMLALGTAMRPMDLCRFPYVGNGANMNLVPHSSMGQIPTTIQYHVSQSKGNKNRVITIHTNDLKELDDNYIKPLYRARARRYEEVHGHKCPPSILFLNAQGIPVTPRMISNLTGKAKERALINHPSFRQSLNFYQSRHWWPTQFLIRYFGDDISTSKSDVMHAAVAQAICNQMGHTDISLTYKYYINLTRVLVQVHQGKIQELVTSPSESVKDFLKTLKNHTGKSLKPMQANFS